MTVKENGDIISWQDVGHLMRDMEETYGCLIRMEALVPVTADSSVLRWRMVAHGSNKDGVVEIAWVGGTLREWNCRTVPGMAVRLAYTLAETIESKIRHSSQAPLPF